MKERDYSLDFLAGLLLIHIIYSHCCSICKVDYSLNLSFVAFYMPWFFFKGGMFFRADKSAKMLMVGGGRLLMPFLKFSAIGLFVDFVLSLFNHVSILDFTLRQVKYMVLQGSFFGNLPLWFLPVLFGCRIVYNELVHRNVRHIAVISILYVIGICLNYIQVNVTPYVPYIICTLCSGTLFFLLGNLLRGIQYDKRVFFIAAILYTGFLLFGIPQVDMRTNLVVSGIYWLWMPFSVCGCVVFNNIVKYIPSIIIEGGGYNLFTKVGTNSMTYYVWHWIFLLPANYVITYVIHVPEEYRLYLTVVIVIACLFLVRKKTI